MPSAISITNLTKRFGAVTAVQDLSLEVEQGEVFGFLGPNGAGKTTTLRVLLGLLFPTGGTARLLDIPVTDPRSRARVGYLPETPSIKRFLTAEEYLTYSAMLAGVDGLPEKVATLLATVGLTDARKRRVGEFSKGMLQRLGLAQALISDPDLLILDEPTAGLDPIAHKEIRDLILAQKGKGKTVFLSSHLLSDVERTCDRIAILNKGRLQKLGRIQDLAEVRERLKLTVSEVTEPLLTSLRQLSPALTVERNIVYLDTGGRDLSEEVIKHLKASGVKLLSMEVERESLEDLFYRTVKEKA
jgi:ABC-2 type transport system ATP-binding protein